MPVRPSDAASLVLVREGPRGAEILMGRRARRHRFLPDMYVYPGGRVDAGDHRAIAVSELRPAVLARLAERCSPSRARALAIAAVRETWEETGIALGALNHDRAALAQDRLAPAQDRLAPALEGLDYIVRAITPPASPIRFHARFFVASADQATGTLRGNGELLDLDWRPIDECMKLPIADITEFVLGEMKNYVRARRAPRRVPVFTYRHGRVSVRR